MPNTVRKLNLHLLKFFFQQRAGVGKKPYKASKDASLVYFLEQAKLELNTKWVMASLFGITK
jgi:hypothetical protein